MLVMKVEPVLFMMDMIDLSEVEPGMRHFWSFFNASDRVRWRGYTGRIPFKLKPNRLQTGWIAKKKCFQKKLFFVTNFCFQKMNINCNILLYRRPYLHLLIIQSLECSTWTFESLECSSWTLESLQSSTRNLGLERLQSSTWGLESEIPQNIGLFKLTTCFIII